VVFVVAALMVVALWVLGGIVPRYREILRRRQAGQEIERLTRVHAALEKEIAQLGEKVARAKGLLASAQPQPSHSGPEVSVFYSIATAARASGVSLERLAPAVGGNQLGTGGQKAMRVVAIGNFSQIAQFLAALESDSATLRVVELNWRKKRVDGSVLEIEVVCAEWSNTAAFSENFKDSG
jgi:hypothetical protein